MIKEKVSKNMEQLEIDMMKNFESHRDTRKSLKLPIIGMSEQNLKRRINEWCSKEDNYIKTGKISGTLYIADQDFTE